MLAKSGYKILLILFASLLGVFSYLQQKDKVLTKAVSVETYVLPLAQHGLQAHIDPDTGRFTRPSPAAVAAVQARNTPRRALQQSSRVKKVRLPDGTLMLDLQQHYRPAESR